LSKAVAINTVMRYRVPVITKALIHYLKRPNPTRCPRIAKAFAIGWLG